MNFSFPCVQYTELLVCLSMRKFCTQGGNRTPNAVGTVSKTAVYTSSTTRAIIVIPEGFEPPTLRLEI